MAAERRPLKILFVGLNYEPESTGIAPYTSGMVRGLAERGHDVRVVTSYPHYPQWKVDEAYTGRTTTQQIDGATVRRVRHYVPRRPATGNRLAMEVAFGLRALTSRWSRPDVIVVVSPALVSSSMASLRARLSRTPVVTWVQDIYTLGITQTGAEKTGSGRLPRLVRLVERGLMARSARVVVIHERFRTYLTRDMQVDTDIDVVRNWSHVDEAPAYDRAAVRRLHGWATDDVIVLHAGNMGAKQGLENVVRASRVAADRGAAVRFVLMGDGLRRRDLETLDPNAHLQFIDPLPEGLFEQTLGAADVLLVNELPGMTEMSVPSKLTTYWATNRPVVAAVDEGSTTAEELAVSGAGLVVEPGRPAALLEAVLDLVDDPSRCRMLSKAGRVFREDHLNDQSSIEAFESMLHTVVSPDRS